MQPTLRLVAAADQSTPAQPDPKLPKATVSADASPRLAVERFPAVIEEALPLIRRHHEEIEPPGTPLALSFGDLLRLDDAGMLRIITARDEGRLIGYVWSTVKTGLWTGNRTGFTEAFYLEPAYRNGWLGYRLLKANDFVLRRLGCKRIYAAADHVYKDGRVALIFKRLGYSHVSDAYRKEIE